MWNNLDFVLLAIITYAWPSSPLFKDESGVFALNSQWLSSWALVVVSGSFDVMKYSLAFNFGIGSFSFVGDLLKVF